MCFSLTSKNFIMANFKELSDKELRSINGGILPILVTAAKWIAGVAAGAVVVYVATEAAKGIDEGLGNDCCECECK